MTDFPESTGELIRLVSEIARGTRVVSVTGLTSIASKAFILARLEKETGKSFVVVTDSNKELEVWENDLAFFGDKNRIDKLPAMESDVYAGISPHAETLEERALALWNLSYRRSGFLITSAKSIITKTVSPDETRGLGANLKRDEDFPPEKLLAKLAACGYVREEPITNIGEFSVRGGIIDVWSPDKENPFRIEFFGDTVDSIRKFDAETQLSTGQLTEASLAPMREFAALPRDLKDWAFFAKERFSEERFARNLKDRTQFADEGETFGGWEFLINLTCPRTSNIFDYLDGWVFVIDEPTTIELHLDEVYRILKRRYSEIDKIDEIGLAPDELFLTAEQLRERLSRFPRLELRALDRMASETDEDFSV